MTTLSRLGEGKTSEHDELLLWISENPEVIYDFIEPILGKFYNKNTSFKVWYKDILSFPSMATSMVK